MSAVPNGYTFDLQSAQRIAATVKKVEAMGPQMVQAGNPSGPPPTSFWAMITGASDVDFTGHFKDWVAVMPAPTAAGPLPSSTLAPSNLWQFKDPYVAGWGNAREMNDNPAVPPGSVVKLEFIGYYIPDASGQGTASTLGGDWTGTEGSDGSTPMYVFNYTATNVNITPPIPFFAIYHPGTSYPQQTYFP